MDQINKQTSREVVFLEGETLASKMAEFKSQQVRTEEEHADLILVEEEPCNCKSKQSLMQALEQSRNKATSLEEFNKRTSQTLRSQALTWTNEKNGLLELLTNCENDSKLKEEQVQGLQEKLARAECAVERLTKSRAELVEEISNMQLEIRKKHDKLTEAEFAAQSLQKMKENEVGFLSGALQTKIRALENAQAALTEKERAIDALSTQLTNLQDVQKQYAKLQEECLINTTELQLLSKSQQNLKHHLQTVVEGHEREMDNITCKLQEALYSHASKDSKLKELMSELHGLQLVLKTVKASKTEADLEANKLKEDLVIAQEAQLANRLLVEKAVKEIAALKEALMAKDNLIINLNAQQSYKEEQHHQRESVEKQLQKCKSIEEELMQTLEKEQMKLTALEELRRKDFEAVRTQEMSWRDEREKILMDLDSMHDLVRSKEVHLQGLEEKLSRAEDATKNVAESRAALQEEVSELKTEMHQVYMQLKEAELAIESLERTKKNDITSLSDLLQVKMRQLEKSEHELVQHQISISALTADLTTLQEFQQNHVSFKEVLKIKEEELHALSLSQEKSRLHLKALEDEYHRDTNDLTVQLEKSLECKSITEKRLEELEGKLGQLHVALDKAQASRTESEVEKGKLIDSLARLQEENFVLRHNVDTQEEHSRKEIEALKASISGKEKELKGLKQHVECLEFSISHAKQQEQQWRNRETECEALSKDLKQRCLLYSELYELHQKTLLQWSEKENIWLTEKENLMSQIQMAEEKFAINEGKNLTTLSDLDTLKSRHGELEQKLASCEGQIVQLYLKVDEGNAQLQSRNQDFQNLQDKLHSTSSTLTAVLQERDSSLLQAKKKLDELESELLLKANENHICTLQIESLEKDAHIYQDKIGELEASNAHLKTCLLKKAEEISGATESKKFIEATLTNTREELRLAKGEFVLQTQKLKDNLFALDGKFQQTLESLQKKEEEFQALLACLDNKDSALADLNNINKSILQEKEVLKQSVNALQEKTQMLLLEIENEKSTAKQLCSLLEEKDRSIASRSEEVRDLRQLLSSYTSVKQDITKYEEKLRGLEENLAEASVSLHDKEERLIASEWAVQQLANEVAKAKNSLAQKERGEMLLQNQLSDVETRLKAKERELMEVDCYLQSVVKKNSLKQSEVETLIQTVVKMESRESEWKIEQQELMSEIGRISNMLENKMAELSYSQEQLKQRMERENMMEAAIQSLKSQLADHAQVFDEQRSQCELLVHELETTRIKESLVAGSLKHAESKLQQVDQRFKEQIEKLQANLSETQEELVSSSSRQVGLEKDLLAAMEEIAVQKEKCCALSEIAAANDSSLESLQCKFDLLQEDLAEQKKLVDHKDTELVRTKGELNCHIDKERGLIERVFFLNAQLQDAQSHSENLQEQKETLVSKLDTDATEMAMKIEEIQQLKVKLENMQIVFAEREALNDQVTKLREELDRSSRTVQDTEAAINSLTETLKNTEIDLVKVREDILTKDDALGRVLAKMNTAEANCLTLKAKINSLEGDLENTIVELKNQVQKTESFSELNGELKEKQKMFEALNAELRRALDDLNFKLDAYCRKEIDTETQAAILIKVVKDMLYLSREDEAEGLWSLKSMLILANAEQSHIDRSVEAQVQSKEIVKMVEGNECEHMQQQVLPMCKKVEELQDSNMLLALRAVVEELQSEQTGRRMREASVVEKTKCALLKLAAKEGDIQELVAEVLAFKRREEDWGNWVEEMLGAQQELEKEMKMVMTLNYPTGIAELCLQQWQSDCEQLRLQATASIAEISQLSDRRRYIAKAHEECFLSVIRSVKEDFGSSRFKFQEGDNDVLFQSGFLTRELEGELTQLKLALKMLVQEANQRDSELADARTTVEGLQTNLQEKTEKEKCAQGQVSALQLLLNDLQSALNKQREEFQHSNASSMDLHRELESSKEKEEAAYVENFSLRSELERVSLLVEGLNRQIKFTEQERYAELSRWRERAEDASDLNNSLVEELTEVKLKVKSIEEKEQLIREELQDWRVKAKAVADDASSLRLQMRKAAEALGDLKLQLESKEEELQCVQTLMHDMKLSLESVTDSKQVMDVELAMSAKQIEDLKKQVGDLKEERACIQKELEEWTERACLASDDKQALQSELCMAAQSRRQALEHVEAEKHCLQLELLGWKARAELNTEDITALRSQLGIALQANDDLERRLEVAEKEKEHLQDLCQKLEANLVCAGAAGGQREGVLGSALAKLKESSRENRRIVEARLQVLHNAMTHGDNEDDDHQAAGSMLERKNNHGDDDKDRIASVKDGNLLCQQVSARSTSSQRPTDKDDECNNKDPTSMSLILASASSPVMTLKLEGGSITDPQHELDHYVELCDSLIRRHARLEKQLEKLTRSASGQHQHAGGSSSSAGEAVVEGGSEKRKKRLLTVVSVGRELQGEGGVRRPLQPVLSQMAVATTPSPCAKRRRSNSSSKSYQNQNDSPWCTSLPRLGSIASMQKRSSLSESE